MSQKYLYMILFLSVPKISCFSERSNFSDSFPSNFFGNEDAIMKIISGFPSIEHSDDDTPFFEVSTI